jgi:hypothetical protein
MSKSKELTNTGLFLMFVLIPAFPIFGIFISTIDVSFNAIIMVYSNVYTVLLS